MNKNIIKTIIPYLTAALISTSCINREPNKQEHLKLHHGIVQHTNDSAELYAARPFFYWESHIDKGHYLGKVSTNNLRIEPQRNRDHVMDIYGSKNPSYDRIYTQNELETRTLSGQQTRTRYDQLITIINKMKEVPYFSSIDSVIIYQPRESLVIEK
jgi:hypothetical protein